MKLVTVLGTRPEIIKLSPLIEELNKHFQHTVIHTGQHYDPEMDRQIFKELKIKYPSHKLKTKKGSFAEQISSQIKALESLFKKLKPDFVIVQGDTNSAMSAAVVAARLKIKVIHIEAGCRSGNMNSPEEQNRLIIDAISSLNFCSDQQAMGNLKKEGKAAHSYYSGSLTFDALNRSKNLVRKKYRNLEPEKYVLVTLHRAENLDDEVNFLKKISLLNWLSQHTTVLFAVHPRTQKYLKSKNIVLDKRIVTTGPLGHLEFIYHLSRCRLVLSDSGGIQEEAAYFDRPCLVLRQETEWMRLVKAGKNFLVKNMDEKDYGLVEKLLKDNSFYRSVRKKKSPESKTGAAKNILSVLKSSKRIVF